MPTDDPQWLLERAIKASGLSARRFAVEVMVRDERTIRRWLAGEPIPAVAVKKLESLMRPPPPIRGA